MDLAALPLANNICRVTDLLERLDQNIRRHTLLRRGQRVVLAVSGGVDSMVLVQIFSQLAVKHRWKLIIAHLNHQLRGRSSAADERLVRQTAKKLKLPYVFARGDVRAFARANKLSLEMAARQLRHEFLAQTALRARAHTVALAHHADDQLELFFLRLLRGSGPQSLAGMPWHNPSSADRRIQLIRPMLNFPKALLYEFAHREHVRFREDATNQSLDFQRNRIRHELLPLLRRKYQPALDKTIVRLMELAGADANVVTEAALSWLNGRKSPAGAQQILARPARPGPHPDFDQLPLAVQRRVLHLQLLGLGVEPEFELIERLRLACDQLVTVQVRSIPSPTPRHTGHGTRDRTPPRSLFRNSLGQIEFSPQANHSFDYTSTKVNLAPNRGHLSFAGVRVAWHKKAARGRTQFGAKPNCEVFDADRVGSKILLRHWVPGDRFHPIGMAQPVKLQNLFTNQKIPASQRHGLLVGVAENDELFWVEGLRISEPFKLTKATKRQLRWQWERP